MAEESKPYSPLLAQLTSVAALSQQSLPQLISLQYQQAINERIARGIDRMERMSDFEYGKCNPEYTPLPKEEEEMSSTINSGIFLDSKAIKSFNNADGSTNWLAWLLGTLLALLLLSLIGWWLFKNYFDSLPEVTPHPVYGIIALEGEPPPEPLP